MPPGYRPGFPLDLKDFPVKEAHDLSFLAAIDVIARQITSSKVKEQISTALHNSVKEFEAKYGFQVELALDRKI